jgi:hypothetical protein
LVAIIIMCKHNASQGAAGMAATDAKLAIGRK